MRNPYFVLGVPQDATQDEIKSAFRRLAMAFHPDQNPDDFGAQERFAELNGAYQIIGKPDQRKLFDDGLIDARGKRVRGGFSGRSAASDPFAGADMNRRKAETEKPESAEAMGERIFGAAFRKTEAAKSAEKPKEQKRENAETASERETMEKSPGIDDVPLGDEGAEPAGHAEGGPTGTEEAPRRSIFTRAFLPLIGLIGGGTASKERKPTPPSDISVVLDVALEDVLKGAERSVALPDGTTPSVAIPKGVADGHQIRRAGLGNGSDGARGDLIVTIRHARHPRLRADGTDLFVEVPVSLDQAVFGATVSVPTLDGEVSVSVPSWSGSDRRIKIAGKGLPGPNGRQGDLYAEVRLLLPRERDERLVDLLRLQRGEVFV